MLFAWLKNRRRNRLLATPFPEAWLDYLRRNVGHHALLEPDEQARLRDTLRVLVAEKHWEGCGGFILTDEARVTIAAQAALLLLGLKHDYFGRVASILVYPGAYVARGERGTELGIVDGGDSARLGEAWYRGPVVLGWDAVLEGSQHYTDGRNVVLHEFAHQLDFLDGLSDGTPLLSTPAEYRRWHEVMTAEYQRLIRESEHNKAHLLDSYGTTNPAEFFAVCTECFFEQPTKMERRHPELYALLRDYYRQDVAERFRRGKAAK